MNFHTDKELAGLLAKSAEYVRAQAAAGRWPHLRVGRSYRFTDEHVAAIAKKLEVAVKPEVVAAESWGRKKRGA